MKTFFTLTFILFTLVSFSQIDGNQGSTRGDRTTGIEKLDVKGSVVTTVSDNQLWVQSTNSLVVLKSVQIYDLSGKLIHGKTLNGTSINLDLAEVSSGIYVIAIQTNSELVTRKIFI